MTQISLASVVKVKEQIGVKLEPSRLGQNQVALYR